MTSRFDLIHDPWIPVQHHDGTAETVSLSGLFHGAAEYARLAGDLPTQAVPILRLALAVLHRAADGPVGYADWKALWNAKRLPADDIDAYLDEHRDRFDLLHPETPFYQVAGLATKKTETGLNAFIADVPTGNPKYATRTAEGLDRIDYAEAARWLVHCQAFDLSGIKGAAEGDPRAKGGKSYPIGPGSLGRTGPVLPEGDTLAETLLLNLIPDELLTDRGHDIDPDDVPVWERDPHGPAPEPRSPEGAPKGLLDLYTWQSRRLRLVHDGEAVTGAVICQGDRLELRDRFADEPMTAWRRSPNQERQLKSPKPVYLPRRHDPDRNAWRGLAAALPALNTAEDADAKPPLVLAWIGEAYANGLIERDRRIGYHVSGIAYGTQEAIITEIIDDRLAVAAAVFDEAGTELAATVSGAVDDAEKTVRALSRFARDLARAAGDREGAEGAVKAASVTAYAALDHHYRRWLADIGADSDTDTARAEWHRTVRRIAEAQALQLAAAAGPAAWRGHGEGTDFVNTVLARNRFRKRLNEHLHLAFAPDGHAST